QRTSWSYDDGNRVLAVQLANGTRTSSSYDGADRLTRLVNLTTTGATISSFRYAYDLADNRTRVIESNGDTVTWGYDALYQLIRELRSGANSYAVTYSHDLVGNRLTMRDGGTPTTYSFDVATQLLTTKSPGNPITFAYDANGNRTKQKFPTTTPTTWSWDYENRLVGIVLSAGVLNTFIYNADG